MLRAAKVGYWPTGMLMEPMPSSRGFVTWNSDCIGTRNGNMVCQLPTLWYAMGRLLEITTYPANGQVSSKTK